MSLLRQGVERHGAQAEDNIGPNQAKESAQQLPRRRGMRQGTIVPCKRLRKTFKKCVRFAAKSNYPAEVQLGAGLNQTVKLSGFVKEQPVQGHNQHPIFSRRTVEA